MTTNMLCLRILLIPFFTVVLITGCSAPETSLTEANYYRLALGMTYADVYAILGSKETECSPPDRLGNDTEKKYCAWKAPSGLFSDPPPTVMVEFKEGKVKHLDIRDIKPSEKDELTREKYNRLLPGMTYAEVYSVLGSKGAKCRKPDVVRNPPQNGRCEWEAPPRFLEPSPLFRVYFRNDKVTAFEAIHLK